MFSIKFKTPSFNNGQYECDECFLTTLFVALLLSKDHYSPERAIN